MADPFARSRRHRRAQKPHQILVVGLGRFGTALAGELTVLGHDVMGVDHDPERIEYLQGDLDNLYALDATDPIALDQVGAGDMAHAVVAIGDDVEASILAAAALVEIGLPDIWAKAITERHATILQKIGAHHVVFPERDMGHRVAHLVTGEALDYIELDEDFVLIETPAPKKLWGRTLHESLVRSTYGITVVCIKPTGGSFTHAEADTLVEPGDLLLVAGATERAEAFAEQD